MNRFVWKLLPPAPAEFLQLWDLPPLLCQLLYNRGVKDDWEAFLAGDQRLSGHPLSLPDMPQAVSRIYRALLRGEGIAIHGDYDADGITATVLLVEGMKAFGAQVIPYIPERGEGHGFTSSTLANLFKKGATLVISADCGTTCYEEVKIAQKRGQDIIITDHHTCPDLLPPAVAVINPKRQDSIYPFPQLAGVGVAYKLIQALLWGQGREEVVNHFFDLIALGTVTDIAPLQGENRYLVKEGLKLLNKPRRPGVAEMIRAAGLEPGNIDPKSISWILGPRLNAAGRLEHAYLSFHLLLTDSPEEGRRLALELEKKNAERQKLLEAALEKAREIALTQGEAKLLMITRDDFPLGIIGLVASRLVDEFHRPAVVVRKGGTISRGSARSIPQFDIVAALKEYSHLFTHFGGHPLAAGFIIPTPHLSQLHQGLVGKAEEKLAGLELRPQIVIDAQIPLSNLDSKLFHFCQQLAPFGQGNPPPTFLSQGVKVVEAKAVGDGEHLRLKVKAGDITWQGIGFGLGGYAENLPPYVDLVYNLALDCWGGEEVLGLNILDLRPSR